MKNIVINFLVLLFSFFCYAQKIERKKIYIKFNDFNLDCKYDFELKRIMNKKIMFNLCGKAILYCEKKSDTINISKLKNYKTVSLEEIEKMEKKWRIDNKKALMKKWGKLYPPYDKNSIFETSLIEIINEQQFVIYPVIWGGLNVAR